MPVLDQSYRRWQGHPTSYVERMLVIPRYDAMEILKRRAWLGLYLVALLPPLLMALYVFVASNPNALAMLSFLKGAKLPLPGAASWKFVTRLEIWLLVAFALIVGPPLATRDFANDALPLYFSKALRRFEYVLGRWLILLALLSAASWIPLLVIFLLELSLAPAGWGKDNFWMAGAILAATIPAILLVTALISATAAHVHRTNLARFSLVALMVVTIPLGAIASRAISSPMGRAVSPVAMALRINDWAFEPPEKPPASPLDALVPRPPAPRQVPVAVAFGALAAWFAGSVAVLAWRVRPVEVVK